MKRRLLVLLLIGLAVGCMPQSSTPSAPAMPVFPTVTPGFTVRSELPPAQALRLDGGLANPATAVAIASAPTATPDATICPTLISGIALTAAPSGGEDIEAEIIRFLSAGGVPSELEETMRDEWNLMGETGFVRTDADLTGEGQPDVVLGYTVPGEGSTLLIAACVNRRYAALHRSTADTAPAPELFALEDMNHDGRADVFFATRLCDEPDFETCPYQLQLISWLPEQGRFVSLLGTAILSEAPPTVIDMDDDQVSEIVVRLENSGTTETGPLRTGVYIYDWNGSVYLLSIVQPDPPRFRIQVIHEADRYFVRREMVTAVQLYETALTDDRLRVWLNNETELLRSYVLYRMLIARAYADDPELLLAYQRIVDAFPNVDEAPVYVLMSRTFWDTFQVTFDLSAACGEVQAIIAANPEAVTQLNRYGSRSPIYTARDLCPF